MHRWSILATLLLSIFIFSSVSMADLKEDHLMPPKAPKIVLREKAVKKVNMHGKDCYIFVDPIPIRIIWVGDSANASSFEILIKKDGKSYKRNINREDMEEGTGSQLFYDFLLDENNTENSAISFRARSISKYGVYSSNSIFNSLISIDRKGPSIKIAREEKSNSSISLDFILYDDNFNERDLHINLIGEDEFGNGTKEEVNSELYSIGENCYKLEIRINKPAHYKLKLWAYDLLGNKSNIIRKDFSLAGEKEKHVEKNTQEFIKFEPEREKIEKIPISTIKEISEEEESSIEESKLEEVGQVKAKEYFNQSMILSFDGAFKEIYRNKKSLVGKINQDFIVKIHSNGKVNKDDVEIICFKNGHTLMIEYEIKPYQETEKNFLEYRIKKSNFSSQGVYNIIVKIKDKNNKKIAYKQELHSFTINNSSNRSLILKVTLILVFSSSVAYFFNKFIEK